MTHRRHRTDLEAGAIAPATAVLLAVLIAFVGLVADVGVWFAQRRDLQAAVDAAALAAAPDAHNPARALANAQTILAANGVQADAITVFDTGWYCPDPARTPQARFQSTPCIDMPGTAPRNAVRMNVGGAAPLFLARLVTDDDSAPQIAVGATAAQINQAAIQAGAGTLALDDGLANTVLSSLAGGTVSLTAANYESLATTQVDALQLIDALALELGLSGGTYRDVLDSEVAVGALLEAAANVLSRSPDLAGASAALAGLEALQSQIPASRRVELGQLFDLGLWTETATGSAGAALDAGVNVLQLTTFALQAANGQNAIAVPALGVSVPGLASLGVEAAMIEPPQTAYIGLGPEGVSVHTGAVRLKLALNLLPGTLANILGYSRLPLYIEAAGGDAQIRDIRCEGSPTTDARVQVEARSGLADIYVGAPSMDVMRNFDHPVTYADIEPAPVLNLNLLGLGILELATGLRGHAQVGDVQELRTFVQPQAPFRQPSDGIIGHPGDASRSPVTPTPVRVAGGDLTATLGELPQSLEMRVRTCVLPGVCLPASTLSGAQLGTLFTLLNPLLRALDAPLAALLQALGVQVGYLDVAVTGVNCGAAVLVT